MKIGQIIETPIKIQMDDLDVGGVVYHGNYLRLTERVRNDLLEELGSSFQVLLGQDTVLAVVDATLKYRRPLRMGPAYVYTTLVSRSSKSVVIAHALRQTQVTDESKSHMDIAKLANEGTYVEVTLLAASLKHAKAKELPSGLFPQGDA